MRILALALLAVASLVVYLLLARWINQALGIVFNPETWVLPPVMGTFATVWVASTLVKKKQKGK